MRKMKGRKVYCLFWEYRFNRRKRDLVDVYEIKEEAINEANKKMKENTIDYDYIVEEHEII